MKNVFGKTSFKFAENMGNKFITQIDEFSGTTDSIVKKNIVYYVLFNMEKETSLEKENIDQQEEFTGAYSNSWSNKACEFYIDEDGNIEKKSTTFEDKFEFNRVSCNSEINKSYEFPVSEERDIKKKSTTFFVTRVPFQGPNDATCKLLCSYLSDGDNFEEYNEAISRLHKGEIDKIEVEFKNMFPKDALETLTNLGIVILIRQKITLLILTEDYNIDQIINKIKEIAIAETEINKGIMTDITNGSSKGYEFFVEYKAEEAKEIDNRVAQLTELGCITNYIAWNLKLS